MSQEINAVSYCIGISVAESLIQQNFSTLNTEILSKAIVDVFENKTLEYSPEQANQIIQKYVTEQSAKQFEEIKTAGEVFLLNNKSRSEISVTESGLQYEVINQGSGSKPSATDTVSVHYHGTLIDGTVFDSSVERGMPATFGVHQVIKGWTEALQLMATGSKYRLYIPQELAYGANPHPGGAIQPFMALIFDVELLNIV